MKRQAQKIRGFTLIEIMVVVVILSILAAIIVPRIVSRPEEAKIVKAKQDIRVLETALELYHLDNGFYPSTDQGLMALVKKPSGEPIPLHWKSGGYIKDLPLDPWNKPYQYLNPGNHGEIDIYSMGPKGTTESEIGNWSTNQPVQ